MAKKMGYDMTESIDSASVVGSEIPYRDSYPTHGSVGRGVSADIAGAPMAGESVVGIPDYLAEAAKKRKGLEDQQKELQRRIDAASGYGEASDGGSRGGDAQGDGVFRDKNGVVPEDTEGHDWSALDKSNGSGASTDVDHKAAVSDQQKGSAVLKFDTSGALDQRPEGLGILPRGAGKDPSKMSYLELWKEMNPYEPVTKEELEKERKKQKRDAIFSAIGDGISAMSNLYFTTQYAPDMSDRRGGMSEVTRERYDRIIKEREGKQREYMEGFLRALAMDRAAENENRNWLHTLEREKIMDAYRESADQRAEAKAERDEAMAELKLEQARGKIDEQKYNAKVAEIKAKYAEDLEKSIINKNNRTGTGGGGRKGGGGKGSVWSAKDKDGNVHEFTASSEANAHSVAGGKGWTLIGSTTTSTSEKTESKGKTTTTTTKSSKTDAVKSKAGGNKMPGVK